jgi:hypothetical protein
MGIDSFRKRIENLACREGVDSVAIFDAVDSFAEELTEEEVGIIAEKISVAIVDRKASPKEISLGAIEAVANLLASLPGR